MIKRCKQVTIRVVWAVSVIIGISAVYGFQKKHEPTTLVYPPFRHAPVHKATAVHLFAFMAIIGRTDITPSDPQGIAVTRLSATDDPDNRNDDDDLTAYVLNSGQNCVLYNSSIQSLDVYEGRSRRQKLKNPIGIAATPAGDVWITDTGHDRVVRLFNNGVYLEFRADFGKKGPAPGQFADPHGIAVDMAGNIYVADTGNDRVQVFDADFKPLYQITSVSDTADMKKSLFRPEAIAVADAGDPDLYYKESYIVVGDLNNTRIRKFSMNGDFIAGVNSTDYGYQKAYLTSLAVDRYGNVWATDKLNHCIHKFDRNLNYLTTFGHIGEDDGEFFEPRSIAIGRKFGQVFIIDKYSAQYYHIGTDIYNVKISMPDSSVYFDFFLTETSKVSALVYDERDQPVCLLASRQLLHPGHNQFIWNRIKYPSAPRRNRLPLLYPTKDSILAAWPDTAALNDSVAYYPSGLYKIHFEAKTTYVYSRYFTKTLDVEFAY